MLVLESNDWKHFQTFFGDPASIPALIVQWKDSIGTWDEGARWNELSETFLHQFSITNAAYAILPYIVHEFSHIDRQRLLDYVVTVGLVENARLEPQGQQMPSHLATPYHDAIAQCRVVALSLLDSTPEKIGFRYLLSAIANLYGQRIFGDMLFHLDCLCGTCPKCEESVYPEEIQESGYV